MRVFSITVPNPYVGEGSKSADRVAPVGETALSYFTVFAEDFEDARKLFVNFCGRGSRVPTLTQIQEIGVDERVTNRVVVDQTPVIYDNVEVPTINASEAKNILRKFVSDGGADPMIALAINRVVQLDDFVPFKGLESTLKKKEIFKVTPSGELEEVTIEEHNAEVTDEMQSIADEVTTDINDRLSFFERLTQKRGE